MAATPTPSDPIELSVVVLAWNGLEFTMQCVESIRRSTDVSYELIIVDNGSTDGTGNWAPDAADIAILHATNLGFAKGMNAGLLAANGAAIAFVNNDTTMPSQWASRLLETLNAQEMNAGIVVPAVTKAGNLSTVRSETSDSIHATRPFRDLPSGVVYVMKTETIRALDGWSERYPIASAEDLDLLFTIWCNGLEVVLDERVLVDHIGGATADANLRDKGRIWRENRRLFVDRWSDVLEEDVPRLAFVEERVRRTRLDQSRTAAWWMSRAFSAEDGLVAERARIRKLLEESARSSPDPSPHSRSRLSRLRRIVGGRARWRT